MGPDGVQDTAGGAGHCGLWPLLATVMAFGWGEDGFGQATTKHGACNITSCFGTPGAIQGSGDWEHWWDGDGTPTGLGVPAGHVAAAQACCRPRGWTQHLS